MAYLYPVPCRACGSPVGVHCQGRGTHPVRKADQAKAEQRATDQALAVACPYPPCAARAGQPCRTAMGTIDRSQSPHTARIELAKRRAKAQGDPAQARLL